MTIPGIRFLNEKIDNDGNTAIGLPDRTSIASALPSMRHPYSRLVTLFAYMRLSSLVTVIRRTF